MAWREEPAISASPRAAVNAKTLRRRLMEPEKRLWWHLRHRLPVSNSHFRRQVALGAYVVDFCCLAEKLIIEVDGGQHGIDDAVRYDARRDAVLEAQGFRILRFTNADVMRDVDTVLDTIFAAVITVTASSCARQPGGTTPTPGPSPQGGGE